MFPEIDDALWLWFLDLVQNQGIPSNQEAQGQGFQGLKHWLATQLWMRQGVQATDLPEAEIAEWSRFASERIIGAAKQLGWIQQPGGGGGRYCLAGLGAGHLLKLKELQIMSEQTNVPVQKPAGIEALMKQRYDFLAALYEGSGGVPASYYKVNEVGAAAGVASEDIMKVVIWLEHEGFINTPDQRTSAQITHSGCKAVENPHLFFKQTAPNQVGGSHVSVVLGAGSHLQWQQNSPGAVQSAQVGTGQSQDLRTLVSQLREALSQIPFAPEVRADVEADVESLEAQAKRSQPNTEAKLSLLKSIAEATKAVAENPAAQLALKAMKEYAPGFFG